MSVAPDLLDVSVWFALSAPDHVHHAWARHYWDHESAAELAFCRTTSLGLLRLLTNQRVLGDSILEGASAWRALETWLAAPGVIYLDEPAGLDEVLRRWGGELDLRGGRWTDGYLAAFATARGARLVSFDADFRRYPGLAWHHVGS